MRSRLVLATLVLGLAPLVPLRAQETSGKAFKTPDAAARALAHAARANGMDELLEIFGPAGRELVNSSDPATARRNRETFAVAFGEEWRFEDLGPGRKELVIGHESWPFPVPLAKTSRGWVFDVAAGKEEILDRRIGRNELAVIQIARAYVNAQRRYAGSGHDGKPAGIYAQRFASEQGTENGLYWPVQHGQPRSPLGDLVAQAAADGQARDTSGQQRTPFHGYYFRILESQGASASGGAKNYVADGRMTGGFALIAWPAEYDASGVMTFLVNQDGVVFEKDLGPDTASKAAGIVRFDPDLTWRTASVAPARTGNPPAR
jgi:hypothetical protein